MTAPPRRPLGRSGLSVAPFALGGNVFGWTADEPTSFRILDAFVDAGYNLIDTADTYSIWAPGNHGGESEAIIGRWLAQSGRRDEVLLATKVGMDMGPGGTGLAPERIRRSCGESLARLRTDHIDLYQAHADDPTTPLEATLREFTALRDSGSVRAVGASNYDAPRLAEALDVSERTGSARFESLQPRYNLVDREPFEGAVEELCHARGLGVLTYSSLASGFLTGKYRSESDLGKSPRGARAGPRLTDRGHRILQTLDDVASELQTNPAAVALAWLMGRRSVTAPIASATSVAQLQMLLGAGRLTLDRGRLDRLEAASAGAG